MRRVVLARVPRQSPLGALFGSLAAGVGELEHATAIDLLGAHQALVLEELKRRVDRTALGRQRPPVRSSRRWIIS